MVLPAGLIHSWQMRLDRLRARCIADPDGAVWLWHVRARILAFLLSRYGSTEEPNGRVEEVADRLPDDAWTDPPAGSDDTAVRPTGRAGLLPGDLEFPPRSAASIRPILDDIERANEEAHPAGPPGEVWEWWRQKYALAN